MNERVDEFFENANVLITGGTGYIGKVLIEKLLRSQPNTNKIYLLIRSKKGKQIEDRAMMDIFDQPIFDKVKKTNSSYMDKIVLIPGDILKPGLGLSDKDKLTLQRKINIVYNVAASLSMKAPLKNNIKCNLVSVLELLNLCRHMENLKSVVIVSTAYSHANRDVIPEKIRNSTLSPELVLRMCDEISDEVLDKITPLILDGHPNTYTFSKFLMENILQRYPDLPIVLFRPAIVTPAYKEPLFGWVDNINGPMGLCLASGLGILRVALLGSHKRANWVPVDKCTNALICSAAHGIQNRKNTKDISVYNYACAKVNRTWVDLISAMSNHHLKLNQSLWMPFCLFTDNLYKFWFLCFFLHSLPAFFMDPILVLSGSKLRLTKIYKEKIYPSVDLFHFFTINEWTINEENTEQMWIDLTQTEQEKYDFDTSTIDFNVLVESCCTGIKVYLMKDKLEDNYKAVRKQKIFTVVHYTLLTLIVSGILWICCLICRQF